MKYFSIISIAFGEYFIRKIICYFFDHFELILKNWVPESERKFPIISAHGDLGHFHRQQINLSDFIG